MLLQQKKISCGGRQKSDPMQSNPTVHYALTDVHLDCAPACFGYDMNRIQRTKGIITIIRLIEYNSGKSYIYCRYRAELMLEWLADSLSVTFTPSTPKRITFLNPGGELITAVAST
jgi:hypothetical protein